MVSKGQFVGLNWNRITHLSEDYYCYYYYYYYYYYYLH